jgi:hypothetical protein
MNLRERIEKLCDDLDKPLAGARQRANTGQDFADVIIEEDCRNKMAAKLRAILASTEDDS